MSFKKVVHYGLAGGILRAVGGGTPFGNRFGAGVVIVVVSVVVMAVVELL